MRKILIITTEFPPYPGGIGTYAYNVAKYASETHNVKVITANYGEENEKKYTFDIEYYDGGIFKKSDLFILILKILKNRYKYDIIHALDWPSVIALDIINIFIKTPYITTIYGTEIFIYKKLQKKTLIKNILLSKCRKFFAISLFTEKLLIANLKINHEDVIMNYLGLGSDFKNESKDIDIYSKYKIDKNKKIILSVSRIEERKGHLDAIKALSILNDQIKQSIIYIIIGKEVDKDYMNSIKEKLKYSKLEYRILGSIAFNDLLNFYKKSYLFLLLGKKDTERVEGFGLVYIEASSQGLPSLAYNLSAVPEVVKNNINGFIVKNGEVLELKNKIELLLKDKNLYKDISMKSVVFANTFSWESHTNILYNNI